MCKVARVAQIRALSTEIAKPLPGRDYAYFDNYECTEDGIAIIRLNGPAKMNTINMGMQKDAEDIFKNKIMNDSNVKAVVFISSKPDNFIAGADIDMIKNTQNKDDLRGITMKAHKFFDEIKAKGLPFVAAINGATMGGGLSGPCTATTALLPPTRRPCCLCLR